MKTLQPYLSCLGIVASIGLAREKGQGLTLTPYKTLRLG